MMWRIRSRSRTICLSLAFIALFLYLLLALVSLPIHHQPCAPLLSPRTHNLRDLARTNYTSVGMGGSADTTHRDSSSKGANKDAKGHVRARTDVLLSVKEGKNTSVRTAVSAGHHGTNRGEPAEAGLSKLDALFDHPLYNIPSHPIPEEDRLLKVKSKVKSIEKSSQMWVSASQEGYEEAQWNSSINSQPPWLRFHLGISRWQLYPHRDPNAEALTQQLATQRIVSAVQKSGGTQLKLVMSFPNYGQAMFKPMKQERDEETNYNLYYFSDFERHNAEIAAFHLDRILGYRRIPPVVGRLVDVVKEIKDVTTDRKLARTFFTSPVGSVCFYGQCSYYCSTEHAVCGRPRDLEASLAVMLPDLSLASRRSWRSPWRRSYSRSKLAKWESDPDYCSTVKKTPPYNKGTRLVDFIDLVILDFLMKRAEAIKVTTCKDKRVTTTKTGKAIELNKVPLTGTEVAHIFAKKRDLAELELYYLKEVDGDSYRPYDLQVVHSSEAGPEHYIFSPDSVLHVTERGYGGLISLAEWYRESVLWTALQEIPFFRNFRLRKAFTWFRRSVREIIFQRKCENLQDLLIIAVPQFRNALFLFTRILEELKGTHRLPQEECQTYTLLEFKNALTTMNQEWLQILEKLSQYYATILYLVKEDSYEAHQELRRHLECAEKPNKSYEPIHLHLAHQQELKRELARSESILQKLGNFAALVNEIIVQNLVTTVRQDVISFLENISKRKNLQQCCLFHTELCLSSSSQLTVDPPIYLFQEAVSEALLNVGRSVIQMCDTSGLFSEISDRVCCSGFTQDLTSDLSCTEDPAVAGEIKNNDGVTDGRKFCCGLRLTDPSFRWLVVPNQTLLRVQGTRVHGCYHPLPKRQLEWQIGINDIAKQVENEQAKIMQEAELEIQQLCKSYVWLMDVHLLIQGWNRASLESMMGQPALQYDEHIKRVHHWREKISIIPSSISLSNRLFIIQTTHIKEYLGKQLDSIEDELLEQLVEQIKLRSESVMSDLERATAELKTEHRDLHYFSKYALTVRKSEKMLADTQKCLEYIHSLQDIICKNYRKLTKEEVALEEKMLATWDNFIPCLKQAESVVLQHRPSAANALDTMFSGLAHDLKDIISKTTSGSFLDPNQNPKEMVSALNHTCAHVHSLMAKLEQLSNNSEKLQEHPMDLTSLTADIQKVEARKELWELRAVHTTWMEEWKLLLFSEALVSDAQERLATWKEQALALTRIIPTDDAVLQETLGILESFSCQLAVMAKLQSPTLKQKHWKAIFEGMGLLYVPENKVTVAELMSQPLELHQSFIGKICRDALAECNMERTFQKLQQRWEARLFHMDKFTLPVWQYCGPQHVSAETDKPTEGPVSNLQAAAQHCCNDARFTVTGVEILLAELEDNVMTLSTMLKSPHSVELRLQMENWLTSLQELGTLLHLFERYQQTWAFLRKMFHETFSAQKLDLMEQFKPVDETFKDITDFLSNDPHVLNFVHSKRTNERLHGKSLYQILTDGLSTMEGISNQMVDFLDTLCEQFPRLWFLSHREVIQLLSFCPTALTLQTFVCRCFKGVRWLEVDCEIASNTRDVKSRCAQISQSHKQMKVLGLFGSLGEHVTFLSPLEPNQNAMEWLRVFEKRFKLTMVQLMKQCAVVQNQLEPSRQDLACERKFGDILHQMVDRRNFALPVLDLLSKCPLQCVLVTEEAVWCKVVQQTIQVSSPVKLSNIKIYNAAKLRTLGCVIRESLVSKYTMICLQALVQLTMNHAQQLSRLMEVEHVALESFEWLSLMKYHLNSEDRSSKASDDLTCYVDVLDHRFLYDHEYFGPDDLVMVHTPSTDRAVLGIVLALTRYRSGFVSGPSMSGKNKTVVQLGKALGRQVVCTRCCPNMRPGVVQRMLLGALQTGAWLLLDSVDLLTQGVLALLGQHLVDIHHALSGFTRDKKQRVNEEAMDRTADGKNIDSGCHMLLAERSICANLNYGCVLISSKGYTCEVPESLRYATRPIGLNHPDHRIIAEVMLTSIGFSEAVSLSRHLVCLIGQAKDARCLPDFISDDRSCDLVVLQKIISASETHLKQLVKQREISNEAGGLAAEHTDDRSSQNVTDKDVEKDKEETEKPSRLCISHLSIIQGLMEETAIVKAIISVIIPFLYEHKKASQFYQIFKDTFPISCQFPLSQQYIEEEEKNQLKDAIIEELERKLLRSDSEIICSALTLYQTMKFSQGVVLVGPSGSGKTTCYCALAGALNQLAAKATDMFGNGRLIEGDDQQAERQTSALNWNSINTVVLFPNAMSHEEVFGCFCEKRGWQDGAVAKALRDSERLKPRGSTVTKTKSNQPLVVKWLVMDGNPVGQPGWLDHLTTLCSPEDPFLCLSSGEILPSHSQVKLLMEVTDLSAASPSVVTRCSLVYLTGSDLWKAVWRSEMDNLSSEQTPEKDTLKIWNRLADDLFPNTLEFLRQKSLTPSIHDERKSLKNTAHGLQEIMSFVRILRALLQHFENELEKAEAIPQIDRDLLLLRAGTAGTDLHSKQELLTRNLFLVAYIWGFSGHLHPRHWPQFDVLARRELFTCRYKIVIPDEDSVFDHFFNIDGKICPKITLTNSITPKYGKYTYLLNLMLEAKQPVLLVGEPASGKTTLCKSLLSFERPHISLPASPLLKSRDLRALLSNINCQKSGGDTRGSASKQPGLLLFVDDLHEAPCDVHGKTSAALETLRQSISKGEIVTFGNNHFKSLRSGIISYMATCCVFGLGTHHSNVISSRLSRLFSIFVLPCLSMDVIFSIHSPRLKIWLKDMPLKQSCDDVARCIIAATESLYRAVCDRFQPAVQKPHFMFSHHDLQKVFWGMHLWQTNITSKETISVPGFQPGPAASLCNIVRLWMHECMRTFGDRLCSEDESKTLMSLIAETAATHYGIGLVDETQPVGVGDPSTVTSPDISTLSGNTSEPTGQSVETSHLHEEQKLSDQSHTTKGQTLTRISLHSEDASQKTQPQILQSMESAQAKLVFGPELTEALKSESQKINFRCSFSYEDRDLDVLLQEVCALIDKQEEGKADDDYNSTTRYIVHRQRVNQLLHILRVLLISGGHGVLIGSDRGTGRKTTVRLAAFVTGCQLVEVHPGNESDLHDILKQAGNQTRMDGVNVIILVHEGISQSAREELLVAMAHRTYPALYTDEELRNLVCRMTAVRKSRRCFMASWMFEKVLSKVHRNVHVFLLLPLTMPSSSEITSNNSTRGWNAQLTKALTLSCCVEVYHPWSTQSLQEVAAQCLKTSPHKVGSEGSEALCVAMAGIHQSACQYASALLRTQPFSPQTYVEFIAHFGSLWNHLHKQRQSQANRVATVLSHVDVMNSTAVQYKQLCKRLQKEAAEMQQHEKELLTAVDHWKILLEEATETCVAKESNLYQMEEQINYAQKQVKPLFLFSLKILNCLNPSDLEEIRHYRDPPDGVVKILDAICLLFNRPPGWDNAKQLLGQPNFFQELEFFDRNTLTGEQLQQLGLIVHSPQFVPESVREVSKACESLCRWVQAVYEWCCMQHHLLAKQHLEQLAREAQGQLHLAKQHMEDACRCLEDAELQLELVQEELEERLLELRTAGRAASEAIAAVEQLETHGKNWRAAAQEAELNNQTLPGDALILAAIISYLGPFGPNVRTELLSKWKELSQTGSISTSPRDSRASLFTHSDAASSHPRHGFPIPVSERLQLPLSQVLGTLQCPPSARMVVKLLMWGSRSSWVQRWPLLADTQQHLEISSQRQLITGERAGLDKETECELVVCADDPELLDKLDQASEKGLRVLLTHLECAVPSPRFMSRLVRPARCFSPGLKQHFRQSHPDFCLFLSTHLPVELLNDEIHPSILARVRVVDLSLGSEELQELMLTQLLQSAECKNLLTRHSQLQNDKQLLREKLVAEEGALMDYILQSNTSLLQDPDFPPLVAVCQEAMKKLQIEIQQLSEELEYHESLLASPRQLTRLAAALYLALQQVARLSPAYYFSLYGFIAVMQEASTIKGGPLVSYNKSKVPEGLIQEVTNRMVVQLLVQYRPCLSKNHFAVLKLLVSVTLLQHNQLCSEAEKVAFLRGLKDLENPPSAAQSSSALPSWIPSHIHPELICLDNIPAFRGLIASLSSCPNQWQEYLHFPSSSVVGSVPCRSHSHLSLLQRALLWKTMVPECLEGLAEAMAVYHLFLPGQAAGTDAPHTGNPEALSRHLDKHKGPIILTLPNPRGDEWTSIHPLHLINKLAHCVAERKVEVVSFGALCGAEDILSKLHHAAHDGHWIVFNNCHLLDQWDDKVVAHLSHLSSSLKEERWLLHPGFRLWFITHEHASRSIPAAVRVVALPLVCDSPWDLKEELSCSLRQAASFIQCHPLTGVTADNVELLLRGAIFHSVLLQRQNYKYSGRGTIYSWIQEDLLTLMDAHIRIASLCHDKKKALQYFAVNIVHGGHALDSADLQVVQSVADTCFSSVSPLWGSRPHILSNVISNPGHFDLTRQLQILEHSLRGSLNVDDALVLGFGADVSAEMIKINSHNLNILLQASQTPAGTVNNLFTHLKRLAPLPAYSHAKDRLQTLKSYLAHRSGGTDANAGAASLSPLRDFLQAEWDELIDSVSSLLSLLHQPVQCGTPTFASLLELTDLSHLERKAELLSAYLGHHSTSDPPGAYRLAAFKNARGFLAAMARGAAEVNRKYISDIALHFQVVSDSTHPATLPLDSVYLCGLELRGASWDQHHGAIQDSASLQQSSLPLVCVKAQVSSTNNARNSSTSKRSDIKDSNDVKVGPQLPLYHCPLYLDGGQESGNWGLADVNIVTTLPLSAKLHPVLCSLRRVRLVSVL